MIVAEEEKLEMQRNAETIRKRLETAEKLLTGLSAERTRWATLRVNGDTQLARLSGDAILASTFITYLGPLSADARLAVLSDIKLSLSGHGILYTPEFDPVAAFASLQQQGAWFNAGLPQDTLSLQNAALLQHASKYGFLVDPQGQGKAWITARAPALDRVAFTTLTSSKLLATVEDAVSTGKTLVVEDIAVADLAEATAMRPLMQQQFYRSMNLETGGWMQILPLGVKELVVHANFSLVLCTREPAPSLAPEFAAQVIVVECGATRSGLEEQLLAIAVEHEQPAIESKRTAVQQEITSCRSTLAKCEAALLQKLNSSTIEELLEDEELVVVFRDLKARVADVQKTLKAAEENEVQLAVAREEYRSIAVHGGSLFFSLLAMATVNSMYVAALPVFLSRYRSAFERSVVDGKPAATETPTTRSSEIIARLRVVVAHRFAQGYYHHDKQLFLLLAALSTNAIDDAPMPSLMQLFHTGASAANDATGATPSRATPQPQSGHVFNQQRQDDFFLGALRALPWVEEKAAVNLAALHKLLPPAPKTALERSFDTASSAWKAIFASDAPEKALQWPWTLPSSLTGLTCESATADNAWGGDALVNSSFFTLLVIRLVRPDRTMSAAMEFAKVQLGAEACTAPTVNFRDIAASVEPTTPVVCFLAEGVDPLTAIEVAAKASRITVVAVSMGTGQEERAKAALVAASAATGGEWVVLQNVHLSVLFCNDIAETMRAMRFKSDVAPAHPSFRLFLTTAPTQGFPVALLQAAYQVTDEPPRGIRAAMLRSFNMLSQDLLDSIALREWRVLVYAATHLHSVLLERRRFGPAGWAAKYEFTPHDLAVAIKFIHQHVDNDVRGNQIGWKAVQFMLGEVHFGGRITDTVDKAVVLAYCDRWLQDRLFSADYEFVPGYPALDCRTVHQYTTAIVNSLPAEDAPEVCGLHPSAERAQNAAVSRDALAKLWSALTLASSGPKLVSPTQTKDALLNVLYRLQFKPTVDQLAALRSKFASSPLASYCMHEVKHLINLRSVLENTIHRAIDCLEGKEIEDRFISQLLTDFARGHVPSAWDSETTQALPAWVSRVERCNEFFGTWLAKGRLRYVQMPLLQFPKTFIASVKLELARAANIALDEAVFKVDVLKGFTQDTVAKTETASATPAFYLLGLTLEGAAWDRQQGELADPPPRQTLSPLPVVKLTVHGRTEQEPATTAPRTFECPVFRTSARGMHQLIMTLALPVSNRPPSSWVIAGVATICVPDE
jgi:dynein heavy chain